MKLPLKYMIILFRGIALVAVLAGLSDGCKNSREESHNGDVVEKRNPGDFINAIRVDSVGASNSEYFLTFIIYFENFGCLSCLNSFLDLVDSLQDNRDWSERPNIFMIFARTNDPYVVQRSRIEAWCRANDLRFPFCLIPVDALRQHHIDQSSVLLMGRTGEVELSAPLPLAVETSAFIIRRMRKRLTLLESWR